jgi:radical SAM protein with 4Fe4S-binding SPASM domain
MNKITDRIDNVTDCSKSLIVPTPFPKSVKIELNSNCNYKCSFCATQFNLRSMGKMDKHLFEKIIDELSIIGIQEVGLFYLGEPFLCDWLSDAIKYVKSKGIPYVFLTTNGSAITEKKIFECMLNGLDSVKFSVNFADKNQFTEITKLSDNIFNRVIENIKITHAVREKNNFKCGVYVSCIRYDENQPERMKPLLDELSIYVDEFYWLPLYTQAGLFDNSTVVGNVGRHDNQRTGIPCWSIFTGAHITHEGLLSACCFDHKNEFIMGDLKSDTFAKSWNSTDFIELRKAHISGDIHNTQCRNCIL